MGKMNRVERRSRPPGLRIRWNSAIAFGGVWRCSSTSVQSTTPNELSLICERLCASAMMSTFTPGRASMSSVVRLGKSVPYWSLPQPMSSVFASLAYFRRNAFKRERVILRVRPIVSRKAMPILYTTYHIPHTLYSLHAHPHPQQHLKLRQRLGNLCSEHGSRPQGPGTYGPSAHAG